MDDVAFKEFMLGRRLYGDDLSEAELSEWYADEAEAYASLIESGERVYSYEYHEMNRYHGYSRIGDRRFRSVCGVGSAWGDEFLPILDRTEKITILDPSDAFKRSTLGNVSVVYQKPDVSGKIPFPDASFDLVTCFGALHHIPNVTYVVSEIGRILEPNGYALIREPNSSMGDWRKVRPGLTKRERGIPDRIMAAALSEARLEIVYVSPCMLTPLATLIQRITKNYYDTRLLVQLDAVASRITSSNAMYFRDSWWKKIAPGSTFWVARKL